jgi:hypothetical protein
MSQTLVYYMGITTWGISTGCPFDEPKTERKQKCLNNVII